MNEIEILILPLVFLIAFMLLNQTLSTRITFFDDMTVSVEYFPFRLLLYDFKNRKIPKRKLKKKLKRLRFFQSSIPQTLRFLLERTNIKIFELNLPPPKTNEPHHYFIQSGLYDVSIVYILTLLYSLSSSKENFNSIFSQKSSEFKIDLMLTTRLYNLALAYIILVFSTIKRRGIKRIVR